MFLIIFKFFVKVKHEGEEIFFLIFHNYNCYCHEILLF